MGSFELFSKEQRKVFNVLENIITTLLATLKALWRIFCRKKFKKVSPRASRDPYPYKAACIMHASIQNCPFYMWDCPFACMWLYALNHHSTLCLQVPQWPRYFHFRKLHDFYWLDRLVRPKINCHNLQNIGMCMYICMYVCSLLVALQKFASSTNHLRLMCTCGCVVCVCVRVQMELSMTFVNVALFPIKICWYKYLLLLLFVWSNEISLHTFAQNSCIYSYYVLYICLSVCSIWYVFLYFALSFHSTLKHAVTHMHTNKRRLPLRCVLLCAHVCGNFWALTYGSSR